jgi:hypothetical protein
MQTISNRSRRNPSPWNCSCTYSLLLLTGTPQPNLHVNSHGTLRFFIMANRRNYIAYLCIAYVHSSNKYIYHIVQKLIIYRVRMKRDFFPTENSEYHHHIHDSCMNLWRQKFGYLTLNSHASQLLTLNLCAFRNTITLHLPDSFDFWVFTLFSLFHFISRTFFYPSRLRRPN